MMRNCFLVCVSGLITAYIICCQVNVTLGTWHCPLSLGIEDILISWFLIILVLLDVALLFIRCSIHCKHLRLSDVNKHTYLLTYLLTYFSWFLSSLFHPLYKQKCSKNSVDCSICTWWSKKVSQSCWHKCIKYWPIFKTLLLANLAVSFQYGDR